MVNSAVYILYGSQTGNAESIAKEVYSICKSEGFQDAKFMSLNAAKKEPLKESLAVVIVCSTTGNGDAPENAEAFWRSIKLRSASKDLFKDLPYNVLGLGDTNYDKFCHMGKSLDKRMSELGAIPILELACADEATNLEVIVEKWKIDILSALKRLLLNANGNVHNNTDSNSIEEIVNLNDATVVSDTICNISLSESVLKEDLSQILPSGIMSIKEVCLFLGLDWITISSTVPDSTILPRNKGVIEDNDSNRIAIINYNNGSNNNNTAVPTTTPTVVSEVSVEDDWSFDQPFISTITDARWLTTNIENSVTYTLETWNNIRKVISMECSLEGFGQQYVPGDAVGFIIPNPDILVNFIIERINSIEIDASKHINQATVVVWRGRTQTLGDLLRYRVDLVGSIKKSTIISLSNVCKVVEDMNAIRWLCTKGQPGQILWAQFVDAQRIGLAEILALFPSCRPTLSEFLACVQSAVPRYYSITSSLLSNPKSLKIAFSVVHYACQVLKDSVPSASVIFRKGFYTGYLETLLALWLSNGNDNLTTSEKVMSATLPQIRLFLKPATTFVLPAELSVPMLLIGPGTGVSPFIGFLEHRQHLQSNKNSDSRMNNMYGEVWLFFGCRDQNDYLYKNELEAFVADGTLRTLETSMSRVTSEKIYVTHRLQNRAVEVAELIVDKKASIYICGDGNAMAKDVYRTLVNILSVHNTIGSVSNAEAFLTDMKANDRYLQDIWS